MAAMAHWAGHAANARAFPAVRSTSRSVGRDEELRRLADSIEARRLVTDGVAHAVASDVHNLSDARGAAAGMSWIRKKLGDSTLTRLLSENPRRILQGELPD